MSELGKSKDTIYANRLDLDKLNVFLEGSGDDPMFLEVESLPNILTYGKHYATLSIKDPQNSPYKLRQFSKILFEVKDVDGNLIYSDVANSEEIKDNYSGLIIFYIWIKENPLRTYDTIKNGIPAQFLASLNISMNSFDIYFFPEPGSSGESNSE